MFRSGFSLVELLLALTLAIFAMTVLAGAILYTNETLTTGVLHVQADWRTRECLDVVRWIRDVRGWDELTQGTHGLASSSGQWELVDAPDDSGRFTRTITISDDHEGIRDVSCAVAWVGQFGGSSVTYATQFGTWASN